MKTSAPKYPHLPLRIRKMPNGHFQDTYTGRWISDAELERYSDTGDKKPQENKHSPSNEEQVLLKRWDLNY